MKKLVFSICFSLLTSNAFADETALATPAKESIDPVVKAVQNHYDKAKSFSADFSQKFTTVDGIERASSGTVWFAKPGLMRWDYAKPEKRYIISDGAKFWSWEPKYRQFCEQNLENSQLPTALAFLSGQGKIADDFNTKVISQKEKNAILRLLPKQPSPAYSELRFHVTMPDGRISRVEIEDAAGNVNTLRFKAPQMNAELDKKLFTFAPPKDAKHICE